MPAWDCSASTESDIGMLLTSSLILPQVEEEVQVEEEELVVPDESDSASSLEAEFEAAAREKLAAQPASLSSLFEDDEVVEVDATVTDETLLVRCPCLE